MVRPAQGASAHVGWPGVPRSVPGLHASVDMQSLSGSTLTTLSPPHDASLTEADQFEARVFAAVCDAIDRLHHLHHDASCSSTADGTRGADLCSGEHGGSADAELTQDFVRRLQHVLEEVCGMTDPIVIEHIVQKIVLSADVADASNVVAGGDGRGGSGGGANRAVAPVLPSVREAFADVVLDTIAKAAVACGANLRVLFKHFDTHSFGDLDKAQLASMLRQLCNSTPSARVLDFVFDSISASTGSVGGSRRVEYENLFNSLFRPERPGAERRGRVPMGRQRTIRAVAVVARHGARLPLKSFPQTLRWPSSRDFWDSYGGQLTPVGVHQHLRLGARLREK